MGSGYRHGTLSPLRQTIETIRQQAYHHMDAGNHGVQVASFLSTQIDTFLKTLAQTHLHGLSELCLFAVGGYGRGLLALYSDLDLLFVVPSTLSGSHKQTLEEFLHILWDSRLKIGHHVMTVRECLANSIKDMTLRTTLLDMRFLWGNSKIGYHLRHVLEKKVLARNKIDFIQAKLEEREKRLKKAGDSRYLVEPNVKEGKGGLRDLQTLLWLAQCVYSLKESKDFIVHGLLSPQEHRLFQKAERFLWSVRCCLHRVSGRAEERLTFDVQREVASQLGYADRQGSLAVERFMTHYFLVARDVGALTRTLCTRLEAEHLKTGTPSSQTMWEILPDFLQRPKSLENEDEFCVLHRRLTFVSEKALQDNPLLMLKIFLVADGQRCDIHPQAFFWIHQNRFLLSKGFRKNQEAGHLFRQILCRSHHVEQTLTRMSEAGVLGGFIPDFRRIIGMMQFNMYHRYTADEHLIRAMGILSEIEQQKQTDTLPLVSQIIKTVLSRDALYLALFLHDIAKGRPEDHSEVGAKIARTLAPRLGFNASETEQIAWLVLHHLVMSDTAQRRDLSDPKTISDFARFVQTPERLKMLFCLTVADICAVGKGVMTSWKATLLNQLYTQTQNLLQGVSAPILEHTHQVLRIQSRLWEQSFLEQSTPEQQKNVRMIFEGLPETYWVCLDEKTHIHHAHCLKENAPISGQPIFMIRPLEERGVTQISIYMQDQPYLFCKMAGGFSCAGVSIVDAKVFTSREGMVLNTFWVQDLQGKVLTEETHLMRIQNTMMRSLNATFDARDLIPLCKSLKKEHFTVNTSVLIDNQASDTHTVLEVIAHDRLGLLYGLTLALSELRLSINTALITTYGEKAVDVFYIKDAYGLKITNLVKQERIREKIFQRLLSD